MANENNNKSDKNLDDTTYKKTVNYIKNKLITSNYEEIAEKEKNYEKYFKRSEIDKLKQDLVEGKINSNSLTYEQLIETKKYFIHTSRFSSYYALRKLLNHLYQKHFFRNKLTYEEYIYSKQVKSSFLKLVIISTSKSILWGVAFFIWMRLVKHKSKKDIPVTIAITVGMGITYLNHLCHYFSTYTPFPLNSKDIEDRARLVEEFVFRGNRSRVLREEIKMLSLVLKQDDQITYSFITPTTNCKVELICFKGKLYMNCDNFQQLFGIKGYDNINMPNIQELDVNYLREYEIIVGMLKLYYILLERFKQINGIEDDFDTPEDKLVKQYIRENKLNEEQLELIKKINEQGAQGYSGLFKNISYDQIKKFIEENKQVINNTEKLNEIVKKDSGI